MRSVFTALLLVLLLAALAGCRNDNPPPFVDPNCSNTGTGDAPLDGIGTDFDPFVILADATVYGGCAREDSDPGPMYVAQMEGSYSPSVTNQSVTADLQLYLYDSDDHQIHMEDANPGGGDEAFTLNPALPIDNYRIEVRNVGPGNAPFSIFINAP